MVRLGSHPASMGENGSKAMRDAGSFRYPQPSNNILDHRLS